MRIGREHHEYHEQIKHVTAQKKSRQNARIPLLANVASIAKGESTVIVRSKKGHVDVEIRCGATSN